MAEVCDALNTDCSSPLGVPSYVPELSDESDADGDLHVVCAGVGLVPGFDDGEAAAPE